MHEPGDEAGEIRRAAAAESLRRHRVGFVRRPGRGARHRGRGEPRRDRRRVRGRARQRPGHRRQEHREPNGTAALCAAHARSHRRIRPGAPHRSGPRSRAGGAREDDARCGRESVNDRVRACYSARTRMIPDDLAQAVLSREDVVRYLQSSHGGLDGRERVFAYLEELKTTQRYPFYRALKHPLYPILRKIDRRVEHLEIVEAATRAGRVIYASNHKSHTDYLVEPVVLDDNGVRPPIIAAGINLFGGPLGLIHRHVTGAIPIRRDTKDPAYLITLKAYISEILKKHDLFFYPEGGRSYSGELKAAKTGLFNAALSAHRTDLVIIPTAIAYDLVLED